MSMQGEAGPESVEDRALLPTTQALLDQLQSDPTTSVPCVFGDGADAIVVREMGEGCVALTERTQGLCPQHEVKRTPIAGDVLVIDLSVDAAWSAHRGITPLFYLTPEGVADYPQEEPDAAQGVLGRLVKRLIFR